jgi:hypothetical protein
MTSPGKRKANRRNPLKEGLFTKELLFTDQENAEYQALRRALRAQLQPTTSLQDIGLDGIACCCWRCKLAIRREMRRLSALLETPNSQAVESEGTTVPNARGRWYAAGRRELLSGIRWLEGLRSDFGKNGLVREEWKQYMDDAFGPQFYLSLTKWTPLNYQTILAAKSLDMHARTYGLGDTGLGVDESFQLKIDPNQGYEMASKLIEQELRHLTDLHKSWEERVTESAKVQNAGSVDFWRYHTTASRDLHRAVDWYLHLKKNGL